MDEIYHEFYYWISGLIEDDPIPFEIKSLVFFVNKNNEIGFSGTEQEFVDMVDYNFYFPLESQYFFSKKLYKENSSENILKKLLNILKRDKYFGKFNIYYGKLFFKAKKI